MRGRWDVRPTLAPFPCSYCDNGLRDVCPIRRGIEEGLPGLRLNLNAFAAKPARRGRPKKLNTGAAPSIADVFRAYRKARCHAGRAAKLLGVSPWVFADHAKRLGIYDALARIKARSVEVETEEVEA